jgi:predicted nucleic-acid-binding Zn-ribbon protein
MPLDSTQQSKLTAWFNSRNAKVICPACGRNNFSSGEIVAVPTFAQGGMQIGGPTVPMVQIFCNNCAHALHFAVGPIGLI